MSIHKTLMPSNYISVWWVKLLANEAPHTQQGRFYTTERNWDAGEGSHVNYSSNRVLWTVQGSDAVPNPLGNFIFDNSKYLKHNFKDSLVLYPEAFSVLQKYNYLG